MLKRLRQLAEHGALRHIDYFFAEHLSAMEGGKASALQLAAALVSRTIGDGNTCLDLKAIAGKSALVGEDGAGGIEVPPLKDLVAALSQSSEVGAPGEQAPLILDEADRLYLGRYWWYEQQVAEPAAVDRERLRESLQRMFPATDGETDWQQVAAAMAVLRRFAVISGGPGTGKTRTVTSILALLLEQSADQPLRIALTAPTGKAAARLTESIRQAKPTVDCDEALRQRIPEEATTI
ncbi:MAG TPA: AAA family ATPase, partial [Gammaproteobacteria bacterium]